MAGISGQHGLSPMDCETVYGDGNIEAAFVAYSIPGKSGLTTQMVSLRPCEYYAQFLALGMHNIRVFAEDAVVGHLGHLYHGGKPAQIAETGIQFVHRREFDRCDVNQYWAYHWKVKGVDLRCGDVESNPGPVLSRVFSAVDKIRSVFFHLWQVRYDYPNGADLPPQWATALSQPNRVLVRYGVFPEPGGFPARDLTPVVNILVNCGIVAAVIIFGWRKAAIAWLTVCLGALVFGMVQGVRIARHDRRQVEKLGLVVSGLRGTPCAMGPGPIVRRHLVWRGVLTWSLALPGCVFLVVWLLNRCRSGYVGVSMRDLLMTKLRYSLSTSVDGHAMVTSLATTLFRPRKEDIFHTHGKAAGDRAAACEFAKDYLAGLGYRYYDLYMSRRNVLAGVNGIRPWIVSKDLSITPVFDRLRAGSAVVLVDVDYYVDMNELLLEACGSPVVVVTANVDSAARNDGNVSYCFDRRQRVHYSISGGSSYEHELWDYSVDTVCVVGMVGLRQLCVAYLVEQKVYGSMRIVVFAPVRLWRGVCAWLMLPFAKPLRRWSVVTGDFAVVVVKRKDGEFVSVASVVDVVPTPHAVTIPACAMGALMDRARTGLTKIALSTVQSVLADKEVEVSQGDLLTLYAFLKENLVVPRNLTVQNFCPVPLVTIASDEALIDGAKPLVVAYMSPFASAAAYTHVDHLSTDRKAVLERVEKVASGCLVTDMIQAVIDCFLDCFVRRLGYEYALAPEDTDDVYLKQNRPSQKHILNDASGGWFSNVRSMFVKAEPYPKNTAPRPITQAPADFKLRWSQYMYAVCKVLKQAHWYAFGLTPVEIAQAVSDMLNAARNGVGDGRQNSVPGEDLVEETDGDKWDGRVSPAARALELQFMLRFFHPMYHDEIRELHARHVNVRAKTKHGFTYKLKTTRQSGDPETSNFNTLLNAFCAFLTRYVGRMRPGSWRLDHDYADHCWQMLGLYGGDDGLSRTNRSMVTAGSSVAAYSMMGQCLKVNVKSVGQPVSFLARWYGDWSGGVNSMADVPRALYKFHVCVRLPGITALQYAVTKAYNYSLSDSNSVGIEEVVAAAKHVAVLNGLTWQAYVSETSMVSYNARNVSPGSQYPNKREDWMDSLAAGWEVAGWHFGRLRSWRDRVCRQKSANMATDLFLSAVIIYDGDSEPVVTL